MAPDWVSDLLALVGVFVLVLANAFFVAAEFSLVSVRRTRIAELAARGNPAARWAERALRDPDRVIAATQLGITLASLGLGWIGEPALSRFILPLVELVPVDIQTTVSHGISAGIAFALITFLHVVIGELAPKSIALQHPEKTSLAVARPTLWTQWIFHPAIWLLNGTGAALLRLLGFRAPAGHERVHSVAELKMIVRDSAARGVVGDEAEDMLHAIFDLGDTVVRQVMLPRTEVVAVPADATLEDLVRVAARSPFTKFPVFEGGLDHILGVVHLRDLLPALEGKAATGKRARDLMREAIFIPEGARVNDLLKRFRSRRQHLAIVLDEYGGTAGLVTLEDLLEEIVGQVNDPFDSEPQIQALPDGTSMLDGLTPLEDVNEHFHLRLTDPHYDTLAGFILGRLGRLAQVGDSVVADGVRLKVESLDGRRIARVSLTHAAPPRRPQADPARE
jgi:CBS domain containing-hemolysin-like protein